MFAILFEALLIEIQEEIPHFPGWEGGGLMSAKIVNKNFVNKLAFPNISKHKKSEHFSGQTFSVLLSPHLSREFRPEVLTSNRRGRWGAWDTIQLTCSKRQKSGPEMGKMAVNGFWPTESVGNTEIKCKFPSLNFVKEFRRFLG